MNFIERLIERAKSDVKTIVLPEGTDERVIKAAFMIKEQQVANVVLVGDEDRDSKIGKGSGPFRYKDRRPAKV